MGAVGLVISAGLCEPDGYADRCALWASESVLVFTSAAVPLFSLGLHALITLQFAVCFQAVE